MIERLGPKLAEEDVGALAELLLDAVAGNSSIGFPSDVSAEEAREFWLEVGEMVALGRVALLVSRIDRRIAGTVQLAFPRFPNGRRRAEIAKLLVHSSFRRRGLATELMRAAEDEARRASRTLLFLDTETGSGAEDFYRELGWTRAGVIPDFAFRPDGELRPTSFFYKLLA